MKKTLSFLINFLFFVGIINAQIPTDGLIAYYPFSGNANDESENEYHGVISGATLTTDRFGDNNSAYSFDGVNDFIKMLGLPTDYAQYTYSAWVKTNTTTPSEAKGLVVQSGEGTLAWGSFGLLNPTTNFSVIHRDGTGTLQSIHNSSELDLDWHCLSITWDGSDIKLYYDGIFQDVFAVNTISTIYDDLLVGAMKNNTTEGNFFNGKIDDIRIYDRALNETEITEIYNEFSCSDIVVNLYTDYNVSDLTFENISPKSYLESVENLFTTVGACDSTVNHYNNFIFNPEYYSDTITVTDTLIIDVTLTGINPPNNINTIKVYPNPAVDYVIINTGDYELMPAYEVLILNSVGQTIYQSEINQLEFQINVDEFSGYGLYFIKIIDNLGDVLVTRKLILE